MLPEEKIEYQENNYKITKVHTAEEFAVWARLANDIFAGGVHRYTPCQSLYLVRKNGCEMLYFVS